MLHLHYQAYLTLRSSTSMAAMHVHKTSRHAHICQDCIRTTNDGRGGVGHARSREHRALACHGTSNEVRIHVRSLVIRFCTCEALAKSLSWNCKESFLWRPSGENGTYRYSLPPHQVVGHVRDTLSPASTQRRERQPNVPAHRDKVRGWPLEVRVR